MTEPQKIWKFRSLKSLARKLRRDLKGVHARKKTAQRKGTTKVKGNDFVLIFAHNCVGKTRLSMEFKELGKKGEKRDTLYFNAFTEDLFDWENDFDGDTERRIHFKANSNFFQDLQGMGIEDLIRTHLQRYADFNFYPFNYEKSEIRFFRDEIIAGRSERLDDIKISRGEENLFIWCFFLAILQLAVEAQKGDPYDWVKYVYIDDPISSLDEHNTIVLATDLAELLKEPTGNLKAVISTHHGLFFNIMFNALKGKWSPDVSRNITKKAYVLHRNNGSVTYMMQDTGESPFLHHVTVLQELVTASKAGAVSQHQCNLLRSIMEKTAVFFGRKHFSSCLEGFPSKSKYMRLLNVRSHAKYSVFEPEPLHSTEKKMFCEVLRAFIDRYPFDLTQIGNARNTTTAISAKTP